MTTLEEKFIIETANNIKCGEPVKVYPINIIKGKSIGDLLIAGSIYKKILAS